MPGNYAELGKRAIKAPRNHEVEKVNGILCNQMSGVLFKLKLEDKIVSENDSDLNVTAIPMEYLNTLKLPVLRPHLIEITRGFIVMILRNINNICGLFNGTRVIMDDTINEHILKSTVANRARMGSTFLILKIALKPPGGDFSFRWQRKQFPVCLSLAMTVKKYHGQALGRVGFFLEKYASHTINFMCMYHGLGRRTTFDFL